MEQSREQKILRIFSILSLVFGIIGIILAIVLLVTGGVTMGNGAQIINDTSFSAEEMEAVSGALLGIGISTLLSGIFNLINWICLARVSKDATKYGAAKVVTIISLALAAVSLVSAVMSQSGTQGILSGVISLLLNGYIFTLINKVRDSVVSYA